MHICGEIPFIKPQTTLKQQINENNKTKTKNDDKWKKRLLLFWLSLCNLFGACEIVGMTTTCDRCQPKQDKSFSFAFELF